MIAARTLLIVAGEASGDRIAAMTAREAQRKLGVECWGVGGRACERAGVEIIADACRLSAMGVGDAVRRLADVAVAMSRLAERAFRTPPAAALLVNFTELNNQLGRLLRRLGVRVLRCVAPQVWAWRPRRLRSLRHAQDRLAVILPFEEALWRSAGVDARYVGHPSLEIPAAPRAELRARLGLRAGGRAVAVLPGSRVGEVERLIDPLCQAAARLVADGSAAAARLICATSLDSRAVTLLQRTAARVGVPILPGDEDHGAAPLLAAFDVALCASGTVCLEAALAGALPVVAYRTDPLSAAIGRRLLRTPHIALPNVLLRRRVFPELLQDDASADRIAVEARGLLARRGEASDLAADLRSRLAPPSPEPFGSQVADLLRDWFEPQ